MTQRTEVGLPLDQKILLPSKKVDSRKPDGRQRMQTAKCMDINSTQVTQLCEVLWWVGN